jgi:hypothetical protein
MNLRIKYYFKDKKPIEVIWLDTDEDFKPDRYKDMVFAKELGHYLENRVEPGFNYQVTLIGAICKQFLDMKGISYNIKTKFMWDSLIINKME